MSKAQIDMTGCMCLTDRHRMQNTRPQPDDRMELGHQIKRICGQITANTQPSHSLTVRCDVQLPRFLSGQVRLSDVEQCAEEVLL